MDKPILDPLLEAEKTKYLVGWDGEEAKKVLLRASGRRTDPRRTSPKRRRDGQDHARATKRTDAS